MMIPFLVSKIHQATVTSTNLEYMGSISIDEEIMDSAGLRENQKVDVYDITNGNRLTTYVIQAPRGSKVIELNGAAARLINPGDRVIIAAYALIDERELDSRNAVILLMEADNRISRVVHSRI
ncbi:MAG: aspartate 1-decarboxylase [Acidobacteriota bacterium]|jgi:aspartate 1-decarboxylase|nr:aspartate 1-decarboxylase [Acidobacteriota bacterium]